MNKKKGVILLVLSFIFIVCLVFINASDEMNVEANFMGYDAEMIQIDVPDQIFLGNITVAEPFYETGSGDVYIENVGREDVLVTPELVSDPEGIFQYISFRKQKTQNGTDVPFESIGTWSINVERGDSENFYMSLDVTDFTGTLQSNEVMLNTTIRFVAMAA